MRVDVPQDGRLRADLRSRRPHPLQGLAHRCGRQFHRVVEMGHDGQVDALAYDAVEEPHQVVGRTAEKAVRPVAEGLGAESDGLQIGQPGLEQGLHVGGDLPVAHGQRIASGEQEVGHFGVPPQVFDEQLGFAHREFPRFDADKLRPAEAKSAVGMAGLSTARKEERRFAVLVLHAAEFLAVQLGDVIVHLPARIRIEPGADAVGRGLYLCPVGRSAEGGRHFPVVVGEEHAALRKSEHEHRVVGDVGPVDQLIDDIVIGLERQHMAHHPDVAQ
jgi:hypothetical protein